MRDFVFQPLQSLSQEVHLLHIVTSQSTSKILGLPRLRLAGSPPTDALDIGESSMECFSGLVVGEIVTVPPLVFWETITVDAAAIEVALILVPELDAIKEGFKGETCVRWEWAWFNRILLSVVASISATLLDSNEVRFIVLF